jgi:hypothetical protein
MSVTAGTDYAFARKTTWIFPGAGVGPATAVLTPATLFLFPHRATNSDARTTFSLGGQHPGVAIEALIADPQTTPTTLEGQLLHWSRDVQGPIAENLAAIKRVRIFTGWLRRSVAFSKKSEGYDLRPASVRPSKDELPAWIAMLRGHPHLEMK